MPLPKYMKQIGNILHNEDPFVCVVSIEEITNRSIISYTHYHLKDGAIKGLHFAPKDSFIELTPEEYEQVVIEYLY